MMTYKPSKLGQTDLVFGLWSQFVRRSVRAGLQVFSLYIQRLWFVPPWLTHRQTDSFCPIILLAQPAELEIYNSGNKKERLDLACIDDIMVIGR